jgi:hypothetical protein
MAKAKAAGGMKKTQMVQAALDALGDPSPSEIQEYVKANHGTELSYAMASSYKSNINKKKGGGGGKRGGGSPSGPVDLADVMAVKELYDRLGADKLHGILKLFK